MPPLPILSTTSNILRLYVHQAGKSETPDVYHVWACIAIIAAAVGDRVWYSRFRHARLIPNMYTLLVGPSGSGKNLALDTALAFIKKFPAVKLYAGKATAPYIIDFLAKAANAKPPLGHSRMFLVMTELAMSVGSGALADDFVKLTTTLYTGADYPITEGTRTSGTHTITNPCLNILAGTTEDWMMRALTRDAIEGGFFARVAAVRGEQDLQNRILDPIYPPDYEDVVEHLHKRIKILTAVSGEFSIAPDAKRIEEQWYMSREVPEDDAMIPSWRRQSAMILKIAMVLSLMDNTEYTPESFVIKLDHFKRAQQLSGFLHVHLPHFLSLASRSDETKAVEIVTKIMRNAGKIQRYKLTQMCGSKGVNRVIMDGVIETLLLERRIGRSIIAGTGGVMYTWTDRRNKFAMKVVGDTE